MILTKDNLLRYIREKKAVTPTMVAEDFETTTIIASAALSELAKEKLIKITFLKLASSPYYYDPKQSSILIELGEKYLKGYDKEIFLKLKKQEVLNHLSLSIQESLAIERIKDFAKLLEIEYNSKKLKFWVWYLRNLKETKEQIISLLKGGKSSEKKIEQETKTQKTISNVKKIESRELNKSSNIDKTNLFKAKEDFESKVENFIENFFKENYLSIDDKTKKENKIEYKVKLVANEIVINFDCVYFKKKPKETELIKFYSSSVKPKIVFIENVSKKLLKLSENLENLKIINI